MDNSGKKTRVLILGGGFGGIYAGLRLDRTLGRRPDCELTLVNEQNFMLFTPMLHEVAASDVDATDIVNPIRKMLRRTTFYEAAVQAVDLHARRVTIAYGIHRTRDLEYDHLLIALGSETRFFDEETRANAMQMKSLADAVFLRNQMIGMLEAAAVEPDAAVRQRLLTFAVAGGGFAGVETIGAMNDFLRDAMEYYPALEASMLRVVLAHPGKVLLPEFDESLGRYTTDRLREAGIDVRLETKVNSYDGQVVTLDKGEPVRAGTLVWTAGVTPPPIVQTLPLKREKGRIVVEPTMESAEFPGLWAVGDAASIPNVDDGGKPFPTTAQHAMREGKVVARNIEAAVLGVREKKPFRYKTLGQLAAIGRRRGAAQVLGVNFSGFLAWWLWRTTYLSKLPRIEKKVRVALDWTLDLFFRKDLVQVLTLKEVEKITQFGLRRLDGTRFAARQGTQANPGRLSAADGDGDGDAKGDGVKAGKNTAV